MSPAPFPPCRGANARRVAAKSIAHCSGSPFRGNIAFDEASDATLPFPLCSDRTVYMQEARDHIVG